MLDRALKASEDPLLDKLAQRKEESDRPVAPWAFWVFFWRQHLLSAIGLKSAVA